MAIETGREHAPYASDPRASRGRAHPEPPSAFRNDFRRDCDRIIHAAAFRRLKYKTQVFVFHEGDHYRTRLTHTLEVMQIARALARALGLDEDLAEALALAHDLGHPPFGHAGERQLDDTLRDVDVNYPRLDAARRIHELIRRLIGKLIDDAVAESGRRFAATAPRAAEEVRTAGRPMIGFSAPWAEADRAIKGFLLP